jgi:hypothetical protein
LRAAGDFNDATAVVDDDIIAATCIDDAVRRHSI